MVIKRKQHLGNTNTLETHDTYGETNCQLNEVLEGTSAGTTPWQRRSTIWATTTALGA